jgi:hypothetical protein
MTRKRKEQRRIAKDSFITLRGLLVDGFRLCSIHMSTWVDTVLCMRRQQLTAFVGVSSKLVCWAVLGISSQVAGSLS